MAAPDLLGLMADAPALTRQLVYRTLTRLPRVELAEALIELVRTRYGDGEAAVLLPGCGAGTVARLLPELDHAVRNWSRLIRRHPETVYAHADRVLTGLGSAGRKRWWERCGDQFLRLADRTPRQPDCSRSAWPGPVPDTAGASRGRLSCTCSAGIRSRTSEPPPSVSMT